MRFNRRLTDFICNNAKTLCIFHSSNQPREGLKNVLKFQRLRKLYRLLVNHFDSRRRRRKLRGLETLQVGSNESSDLSSVSGEHWKGKQVDFSKDGINKTRECSQFSRRFFLYNRYLSLSLKFVTLCSRLVKKGRQQNPPVPYLKKQRPNKGNRDRNERSRGQNERRRKLLLLCLLSDYLTSPFRFSHSLSSDSRL